MTKLKLAAIPLSFGLLFSACKINVRDTGDKSFLKKTLLLDTKNLSSAMAKLDVNATNEDIIIVGESDLKQPYIKILANTPKAIDTEEGKKLFADKYKLNITNTGDLVKIGMQQTVSNITNFSIQLELHVSKAVAIKIAESSGDINISDINAPLVLAASSGDIMLKNIQNNISVETTSGDINVSHIASQNIALQSSSGDIMTSDFTGDAIVHTSSGDIFLEKGKGNIQTVSSSGDTHVDMLEASVQSSTSSGDQAITIAKVIGNLTLTSGSGDIQLSVPQNIGYNIDWKGNLHYNSLNNFSQGSSSKESVKGLLNNGGVDFKIRTGSGDFNLSWL